jgi:hypothetical protein
VVVKVRERLAVSQEAAKKFYVEIFNLRKISEMQVRKLYQIIIANRFTNLETLSDSEDIKRAWETFKNIKTSAKEILGLYE